MASPPSNENEILPANAKSPSYFAIIEVTLNSAESFKLIVISRTLPEAIPPSDCPPLVEFEGVSINEVTPA